MTTKTILGATIALMMVAMILSLKNYSEKKEALIENKFLKEQLVSGNQNNGTAAASMVNALEKRLREESEAKDAELARIREELDAKTQEADEKTALTRVVENREKIREQKLSPLALKIKAMPAIGKVLTANSDWGFVNFDAGSESGVASGMEFAVRRDHYLIARVKVDTTEENKSVANIVGNVSEGMQIQPGDDMIAYPVQ